MYRQLLHTADISPFDIIVLFFWQAQWARSIISAVLFLFHWVHTLTMVTFLTGSTCALPILYNNLQPILTSVTTSWCDIMCMPSLSCALPLPLPLAHSPPPLAHSPPLRPHTPTLSHPHALTLTLTLAYALPPSPAHTPPLPLPHVLSPSPPHRHGHGHSHINLSCEAALALAHPCCYDSFFLPRPTIRRYIGLLSFLSPPILS